MDPFETLKILVNEHLDKCSQEYQSLKDKYEKLQLSSTKTNDECKTLKSNLISTTEKNGNIANELTALKQKNEELLKELAEFRKQLSNLKKRNEQLQKESIDSGSSLDVVLNRKAELEISLNEAKTELKDIKNKLRLVTENKSKLEREHEWEKNKNSKLAKCLEEYQKIPETITNALGFISKTILCPEISEDENCLQSEPENASAIGSHSNLFSLASIENISRTQSGAKVSLKKDERVLSSPISILPNAASLENLFQDKPASAENDRKTTQHSPAENINTPTTQSNQLVPVLSPKNIHNIRRSPIPSVSFATPKYSCVDIESEKRPFPATANVKVIQTNFVVSKRKDSPDPLRSRTPAIPATSNNASKVGPVAEGVEGIDNRSSSPSFDGLQNRPNQPKSILLTKSDHFNRQSSHCSILAVPVTTNEDEEKTDRKLIIEQTIPASSLVAFKETIHSSPLNIRMPSHKAISSISPNGEPKEDDNYPAAIAGTQNNQIITAATPNKHLHSVSKTLANSTSGNKERGVHSSRSSLLIYRAQETQRDTDEASRGDQTGSQTSFAADPKPASVASVNISEQNLPPLLNAEVPAASRTDEDQTNEISKPENRISELFLDLRNTTPRRSLTDNDDSSNLRNLPILFKENVGDSQCSGAQSIPDTSNFITEKTYQKNKFPIVFLPRVELPEKFKQTTQDSEKNQKSSQDFSSASKKRKSVSEHSAKRQKSKVEKIGTIGSPNPQRQIKQRFSS